MKINGYKIIKLPKWKFIYKCENCGCEFEIKSNHKAIIGKIIPYTDRNKIDIYCPYCDKNLIININDYIKK